MGSSDDFDVVVICSGNRFRSPIAEAVLRREAEGLPVRVRSFGTMDAALRARALRGDRARAELRPRPDVAPVPPARRRDLSGADLVIGFEQIHVSMAVVGAGAQREADVPDHRARRRPGRKRAFARGRRRRPGTGLPCGRPTRRGKLHPGLREEIARPDRRAGSAGYRKTADEVYRLTTRVAERLFG